MRSCRCSGSLKRCTGSCWCSSSLTSCKGSCWLMVTLAGLERSAVGMVTGRAAFAELVWSLAELVVSLVMRVMAPTCLSSRPSRTLPGAERSPSCQARLGDLHHPHCRQSLSSLQQLACLA